VLQSAEGSQCASMRHGRSPSRQIKKLRTAFASLSPGKQREYTEYIEEAKRDATKQSRLAKITPMILAGAGLNDR
jgi:uncharacterized protein YdeI (YjbR/CyaY-like superfamily)